MSSSRRFPWKWILLLLLLLALGWYFGGGLWGFGVRPGLEQILSLPEQTPKQLLEKWIQAKESLQRLSQDEQQKAQDESHRLKEILDAWAEDSYRNAQSKVKSLLEQGKLDQAREIVEKIPAEYYSSSYKQQFEELKRQVQSP